MYVDWHESHVVYCEKGIFRLACFSWLFWPSNILWRSWSTLVQVMACCNGLLLNGTKPFLGQGDLVLCCSFHGNVYLNTQDIILKQVGFDTWKTRYADGTPTSEVTPVTIRYIRAPHHGHTSQYHGHEWMTHILFVHCQFLPHSWDKAISDSDLETPRSRSWVWSKGKVIQLTQYHINSLPFHLTSIRPTILQIELFWNLTWKHPRSRSWGRSKVKVTYCTQYPTNALPFCFTSIGPTIPEIWPK